MFDVGRSMFSLFPVQQFLHQLKRLFARQILSGQVLFFDGFENLFERG